jgi:hypothetical protein
VPSYWHEMGYEAKRSWTHWFDGKVYKSRAVASYFFLPFLSIWLHAAICNIHMGRHW